METRSELQYWGESELIDYIMKLQAQVRQLTDGQAA